MLTASFACFPQREEALKQHKALSQELVNLRGELGKSFFLVKFYGARDKLDSLVCMSVLWPELHAGGC